MDDIKELVKYDVTELALESYRSEFLPLVVDGLKDHEGYAKVKDAWLFIRGERMNVEKRRVELKAQSLEYGRAVDAEAKRITAAIAEVEDHLFAEKQKVDDEVARIKFVKEQREKLTARMEQLTALGEVKSDEEYQRWEPECLNLDDNGFTELMNRLTTEKLERQRLAQEKKEQEHKAEMDSFEALQRALEQQKLDAEREERHKAEVEQARKDAAEKTKFETEREAQREAQRKEDARIEAERIEAERPDAEKLKVLGEFFVTGIPYPEVSSKKAVGKIAKVKTLVAGIVSELKAA